MSDKYLDKDGLEYFWSQLQTMLNDKVSLDDIFGLEKAINTNDDLNNYTTGGLFYSSGAATSGSLDNCPHKASAFQLFVYTPSQANVHQLLFPISSGGNGLFYKRVRIGTGENPWSAWAKISSYGLGTQIPQYSDPNNQILTDLNDYKETGMFYCNSNATAGAIYNCPVSVMFHLEVKCTTASSRYMQELTTASIDGVVDVYKRIFAAVPAGQGGGTKWWPWYHFAGTVVQSINVPS